jgi:tetratricopeptide (TPR) repeat protein
MKKTLITLFGFLILAHMVLSIINAKSEYQAERAIWKVNREFAKISKDPTSVPEVSFEKVAKDYERFTKQYPKTVLTPIAHLLIGRVYATAGNYAKSREIYEEVAAKYKDKAEISSQAVFEISRTYFLEKKQQDVISTYVRIRDNYPFTEIGFQVPILIAEYYANIGDSEGSQKALNDAVDYYKKLSDKYKNSEVEFNALRSVAICYIAAKKWDKAVETLGQTFIQFSDAKHLGGGRADRLIKSINSISLARLKDYDLPIGIYEKFIAQNPKHPFNKKLEEMIQSLKLLKDRSISVSQP